MPSLSSCDNNGAGDLKRYIVKRKPVTHAAVQTPPPRLTRLTRCQHSDDHNLHTFCRKNKGGWVVVVGLQSNDLMQAQDCARMGPEKHMCT